MLKEDGTILLGKAGDKEVVLYPSMLNRHGLIAGATGTGKTVTLKVIAESLSELGVPTVIADVKQDLSGMIVEGDMDGISGRLESMGINDYSTRKYPVHFFDVYGKTGHPLRARMQDMGPLLLSQIMDLSDAQAGVLNIIFKAAEDMELDIIDLKDLQAMTQYVGEHASDMSLKYGNVAKQSVGAIQRKLLELENEGADSFFGMPSIAVEDWMETEGKLGIMNIIECQELFQHPHLYAIFLYWMLKQLQKNLPEEGDMEKPKIVFFFDEAHLLFDEAPKKLLEAIEQTVKLIRSKGVGIFFCTQTPADIPGDVLAQLGNRIQHSLRAYTPAEIKAAKMAAESFRQNPELDAVNEISNMKTGTALVSVLDADGAPTIVEKTKILPPHSSMEKAADERIESCIENDSIYGKYEKVIDPESAYEAMDDLHEQEEKEKQEAADEKARAKEEAAREKAEARAKAKEEEYKKNWDKRLKRKAANKIENEVMNAGIRSARKFLKNLLK